MASRARRCPGQWLSVPRRLAPGHPIWHSAGRSATPPEPAQCFPAQPQNVPGLVAKQISRIFVPVIAVSETRPYPVNPAIAAGLEQSAGKAAGYAITMASSYGCNPILLITSV